MGLEEASGRVGSVGWLAGWEGGGGGVEYSAVQVQRE